MNGLTRRRVFILAALLLGTLLLTGCMSGKPAVTPSPAPTDTPVPTPLPDVSIGGMTVDAYAVSLNLSGRRVTRDALLDALSGMPRLKTVNLRDCALSDADKAALMEAFPTVEFLWVVRFSDGQEADSRAVRLTLGACTDEDADAFFLKLRLLPKLQYVDMCGCRVDNADMDRLRAAYPDIRFVWLIRIGSFELRTDVKAFSMGKRKDSPGVHVLGPVYYHRLTNEDVAQLRNCTELEALDIGHAKNVSDVSFLSGLTKLRYLVIAIMSVEDLSPLSGLQELEYLECLNNRIHDISPLAELPRLRFLNCGMNPFTDIEPLKQMTQLERLWVNRSALTRTQWHELEDALPDTQIKCAFDSDPMAYGWRDGNEGYRAMQEMFGLPALSQSR